MGGKKVQNFFSLQFDVAG